MATEIKQNLEMVEVKRKSTKKRHANESHMEVLPKIPGYSEKNTRRTLLKNNSYT